MIAKIHATWDAPGNLSGFHLTSGQAHGPDGADALLPGIGAAKPFDTDERLIQPLQQASKRLVIPLNLRERVLRGLECGEGVRGIA